MMAAKTVPVIMAAFVLSAPTKEKKLCLYEKQLPTARECILI